MSSCILAVCFLGAAVLCLACVGLYMIKVYDKHQKKLEEISKYNININAVIDQAIPELLEGFVASEFETYQAKNLAIEDDTDGYITAEKEKEIIKDMINICSSRLSPNMVDKLSLFWHPDSIASVIADQIYLQVVGFVSVRNATKAGNGRSGKVVPITVAREE